MFNSFVHFRTVSCICWINEYVELTKKEKEKQNGKCIAAFDKRMVRKEFIINITNAFALAFFFYVRYTTIENVFLYKHINTQIRRYATNNVKKDLYVCYINQWRIYPIRGDIKPMDIKFIWMHTQHTHTQKTDLLLHHFHQFKNIERTHSIISESIDFLKLIFFSHLHCNFSTHTQSYTNNGISIHNFNFGSIHSFNLYYSLHAHGESFAVDWI